MAAKGEKLSAEIRAKISKALIERFRATLNGHVEEPQFKRCIRCGETKPVAAFYHVRRSLKSGIVAVYPASPCKACKGVEEKARRDRLRAEGKPVLRGREKASARRLTRRRENATARRRAEGIPPRNFKTPRQDGGWERPLPSLPLREFLEKELAVQSLGTISAASGIPPRTIFAYLHGERATVTLRVVDQILHGLGKPEEMSRLYPDTSVGYHYLEANNDD